MIRIGRWLISWRFEVIDTRTDTMVWYPGISAWRQEINRNV